MMMGLDRIWTDGPVRAAVRVGIPAGLFYGLLQFLGTGSAPGALLGGVFFAVALAPSPTPNERSWPPGPGCRGQARIDARTGS